MKIVKTVFVHYNMTIMIKVNIGATKKKIIRLYK